MLPVEGEMTYDEWKSTDPDDEWSGVDREEMDRIADAHREAVECAEEGWEL